MHRTPVMNTHAVAGDALMTAVHLPNAATYPGSYNGQITCSVVSWPVAHRFVVTDG